MGPLWGPLWEGPPPGAESESFRYEYGTADELERIVREAVGEIAELETGDYGRITSRDGAPFGYDGVGRRLEDDRFVYRWSWRDELLSVTVKNTWPDADGDGEPDVSPYAGHQIRYDYDAAGRLTHRWHLGVLPAGETDDGLRPFIEKRAYVWEGQSLLAEAAYGNAEETLLRWRKTLVPGASGLDDAVQVIVEIGDQPGNPFSHTTRTYTYLRDELGTVIGLVAEDEGSDPENPPVPVRYLYNPYGEAHAETGPELRRGRFDRDRSSAGGVEQTVAEGAVGGAMLLDWSIALDASTLDAGVTVERLVSGSGWVALSAAEAVVAFETGGELPRIVALATNGWAAGTSYRVRITPELADSLGRSFGRTESLEWRVPDQAADGSIAPVLFEKRYAVAYDSTAGAATTAAGRFPGGQPMLFQGAWTDPVTGVAHHRARWYDSRNAVFLSEDPMLDVDSQNRYAFVGWAPSMGTDPLGLCSLWEVALNKNNCRDYFGEGWDESWEEDKDGVSMAVSFVPGLGDVKDAQEAITGKDLVTGEELTWAQRAITGVAAVVPIVGGKALREALQSGADLTKKTDVPKMPLPDAGDAGRVARGTGGDTAARATRSSDAPMSPRRTTEAVEPPCPTLLNCFAAGTLVATADGLVPIEDITVGHQVYAFDDGTGEEHLAEVVALHHREVDELWILRIGDQLLETTDEHPFYVADRGWTEASRLEVGDAVVLSGGERLPVVSIERVPGLATVYNFEVEGLHSYFVGEVGVVVHNCRGIDDDYFRVESSFSVGPTAMPRGEVGELLRQPGMKVTRSTGAGAARPSRHHIFPQAEQMKAWFNERAINVDQFTVELGWGEHSAIHSIGWNTDWAKFIKREALATGGGRYSKQRILRFGIEMMRKYNLPRTPRLPYR